MPEESDELRTATESDDEGGPVKSFLEHLEDLRWVLIKSLASLGVAFIVCLVAVPTVMKVLTFPLSRARLTYPAQTQVVTFLFGTNRLGVFPMPAGQRPIPGFETNQFVTLHVQPINVGTNLILGLRADSDATEAQKLAIPLVSFGPANAFIVAVQVAIYAGGLIASPFILFFIASFVFPALKMKERKYIYRGLFYGIGLFLSGVAFCYFALMPIALVASFRYTGWMGIGVPQWRAEEYISFVCKFMLGMGLGFEMPVILLVLVKIGILNYSMLSKARRYVIILNFLLGAILTTPEILTQVLMAFPLQVLYEITIWIAWYWERREKRREAAEQPQGVLGAT
ncbi:MAG: twin-arginine translocase subunit TatC [Verrucomicrobia bacterium]|nr:MAG: twin-arginine translocase subunit TatC [Verrucomicrobiota bacterium]